MFSNLFKKSPKEEPDKKNPLGSPEMQKKRYDAALDFLKIFQERMPLKNDKPHAGTVLSVAARLAGTSLFRAINKEDFPTGTVILSEEVNQAYPQLLNLFAFYCKQNGVDVISKPLVTEFPPNDKPLMDLAQIQVEYQDKYNAIMNRYGLDYLESARAGMVICSIAFEYHRKARDIDPHVATGIVAMGVVEGAKTAPVPLKSESGTPPAKQNSQFDEMLKNIATNQTNGSGQRLVIGEGMASMREAMSNGGKYILLHPEVENKLKQNNINPYLVYEAAMQIETGAKIPSIDFVSGNVDELVATWSGKPQDQAPIHVRLALWLEANASNLRYERKGNRWALKN